MGIEDPGRHLGRDPVREGHQGVRLQQQVLGLGDLRHVGLAGEQRFAPAGDDAIVPRGRERLAAGLARQQDAALLEGLADAGDTQGTGLVVERLGAPAAGRKRRIAVRGVHLAAGEDGGARETAARLVSDHQKYLDAARAVAQQQRRRRLDPGLLFHRLAQLDVAHAGSPLLVIVGHGAEVRRPGRGSARWGCRGMPAGGKRPQRRSIGKRARFGENAPGAARGGT